MYDHDPHGPPSQSESEAKVRHDLDNDKQEPRTAPDATSAASNDLKAIIHELAGLDLMEYEQRRKEVADGMNIRVTTLDSMVEAARPKDTNGSDGRGRKVQFAEFEPWPEYVAGAGLMTELVEAFHRHLSLSEGSAEIMALWVLHTHTLSAWHNTPRLAILSPEKRCGKTTALEVVSHLVLRPLMASNISTAAVFRTIELYRPTFFIDEADTFLNENNGLSGVLNSGHSRSGSVVRIVGEDNEPRMFSTWGPVVIAMIGKLRDTLEDRSIVIEMRRRRSDEPVASLRGASLGILNDLGRKCARWATEHSERLETAEPDIPSSLHDRAADNWQPLFAIADAAGGEWPIRSRHIAEKMMNGSGEEGNSIKTELLADIRALFIDLLDERIPSESLVTRLGQMDERPWSEYRDGKPITQIQLAKLLKPFGIQSKTIRIGTATPKGYEMKQFKDAFDRYLPPETKHRNKCIKSTA